MQLDPEGHVTLLKSSFVEKRVLIPVARFGLLLCGVALLTACSGSSPGSPTSPSPSAFAPSPVATPAPATPANIAGSYNLVITASSVCASNLPAAARVVRQVVTIAQSGADFTTSFTGGDGTNTFVGTLSGPTIRNVYVSISATIGTDALIVASASGTGTVASAGTTISGTLSGNFLMVFTGGNCNAFDHQFQFTRR